MTPTRGNWAKTETVQIARGLNGLTGRPGHD